MKAEKDDTTTIRSHRAFTDESVTIVQLYYQKLSEKFPDCSPDALLASASALSTADIAAYGELALQAQYTPAEDDEGEIDRRIRLICKERAHDLLAYQRSSELTR